MLETLRSAVRSKVVALADRLAEIAAEVVRAAGPAPVPVPVRVDRRRRGR